MSTRPGDGASLDAWIRRLTIGFCLVALVLGAAQAWTSRFDMNPDGISYLDNAQAWWSGDFRHAINAQWSPLYPWLIGAGFAALRPTPWQEFPAVHLLNFLLYLASLAAFLFFMASLDGLVSNRRRRSLRLIGYSAFLYCSLDFTSLRHVTPDLLVNLFAFLAAGFLVRMAGGAATTRDYALFGVTLGLGYLAKAPFLVFGLLCLGMSCVLSRRRSGLSALAFVAIAAPYIAVLSSANGRFTAGDSAKLNMVWNVNGLPNTNWQGGPVENGRPLHPTRQLSTVPEIFEFDGPVAGTYPPWDDPAYWNEGARVAFRPGDFARAVVEQIRLYAYLVYHRQVPLVFALLALFLLAPAKREIAAQLKRVWSVLVLGATPFLLYAPVHAEDRYLAPFFVLLWVALFVGALGGAEGMDDRTPLVICGTAALLMLAGAVAAVGSSGANGAPRTQYEIAHSLESQGLKKGDEVAIVRGDPPYYWARLAGARITMEISFAGPTCPGCLRLETQWEIAQRILSSHGAVLLVAPALAGIVDQPGWKPLGNTGAFAYRF